MRRTIATAALLVGLALPASAGANYALHHPKREHCRHGYVRKHSHRRTLCVAVKPKAAVPAPAPVPAPQSAPSAPVVASPAPAPAVESAAEREAREVKEYGINPDEHDPACTPQLEAEEVACEVT